MKKIGFVTPWYGENIPGGAEMALRGVTRHLMEAGVEIEILTTCVKEFGSSWTENYHDPGESWENDIHVRRFPVKDRDKKKFDAVNIKLICGERISADEEQIFIEEMINSPKLYRYIEEQNQDYDLFVYIPYMFGPVYYGIKSCIEKAVMIPCFHDEAYVYMGIFRDLYSKVKGMIFNSKSEQRLTNKIYNLDNVKQCVPGLGLETDLKFDAEAFREKFGIQDPFVLYAGRKDDGKNVGTLIRYFKEYKARNQGSLKLVLIGGGSVTIPGEIKQDVYDLGFVDIQDKYNAYGAAAVLCQPSKNESFSFVIMESWLCERPVLVHDCCAVTRDFVIEASGGLYFGSYYEFEECLRRLLKDEELAKQMGRNGKQFVLNNFKWEIVTDKYIKFFEEIIADRG
ncbi:glycosyltransferase family 4 protein [Luxibacter massiliensis]|uniref:glycosyltransferase family 4 protein n=1 Tax=Luxibacter massiliensis TaxID=2219695 RepID=UPI000F070361|nr:glycosyltransferase family 4 protein [Luxibacter massiliensis]